MTNVNQNKTITKSSLFGELINLILWLTII